MYGISANLEVLNAKETLQATEYSHSRITIFPRGIPPAHPYVSLEMQSIKSLQDLPPAAVFTCGFGKFST